MPDHDKLHQWPEHDKLREVAERSHEIGEFIEWLEFRKGLYFGEFDAMGEMFPAHPDLQRLLAEYFGINLRKLEAEKRDMLTLMKEAHDDS